jgi:hypothetical protein
MATQVNLFAEDVRIFGCKGYCRIFSGTLVLIRQLRSDAVIPDHAPSYKSVPDEQNDHRPDGCANKSGEFAGTIQTGRVTNRGCEECPGDTEQSSDDKTLRRVGTRHKQARDGSGNKTS